jgi:hypothetical protein
MALERGLAVGKPRAGSIPIMEPDGEALGCWLGSSGCCASTNHDAPALTTAGLRIFGDGQIRRWAPGELLSIGTVPRDGGSR